MPELKDYDYEFLLDKSGSMATKDCPGGKSRWDYAKETGKALATFAEQYDNDGITVVPFAGTSKVYEGVTASKVDQVFSEHSPMGSTNTADVLQKRLDAYLARKKAGGVKPLCMFVLTDGAPDDQVSVAKTIAGFTKNVASADEVGIQMVRIGQDPEAKKFMTFLDDELVKSYGAAHDIVKTRDLDTLENFSFQEMVQGR